MRNWWIGWVVLAVACSSDDGKSNNEVCTGANCIVDSGSDTSSADVGSDVIVVAEDCVADGCTGGLLCNENTKKCVPCEFDEACGLNFICNDLGACECAGGFHDCSGACVSNTDVATCGTSCEPCAGPSNGNIMCDGTECSFTCNDPLVPLNDTCVGCASNTDCTGAAEARCDAGTCVACAAASDCSHIAGAPICSDGTCVECGSSADCGGSVCDTVSGTCTQIAVASVTTCKACPASDACEAGSVCMPLKFNGADYGNYCLPIKSGEDCPSPWVFEITRAPIDGNMTTVCGLNEPNTTCEAILDFGSFCPTGLDSECGAVGVADGRCEPVGFDAILQCTYSCTSSTQCLPNDELGCISADYCGGF